MQYNGIDIENEYKKNLSDAQDKLASLSVTKEYFSDIRNKNDSLLGFKGLNGWVYEQTIRYCLCEELKKFGKAPNIKEQEQLYGRTKVDLLVGKVAIEIKVSGLYNKSDAEKYRGYSTKAKEKGWYYFYLTQKEGYPPYQIAIKSVLGEENTFFLNAENDWERFVNKVLKHYEEKP